MHMRLCMHVCVCAYMRVRVSVVRGASKLSRRQRCQRVKSTCSVVLVSTNWWIPWPQYRLNFVHVTMKPGPCGARTGLDARTVDSGRRKDTLGRVLTPPPPHTHTHTTRNTHIHARTRYTHTHKVQWREYLRKGNYRVRHAES